MPQKSSILMADTHRSLPWSQHSLPIGPLTPRASLNALSYWSATEPRVLPGLHLCLPVEKAPHTWYHKLPQGNCHLVPQTQTSKTGSRVLLRHQYVKLWYLILKSFSFWESYLQSLQKECTTILGVFMVQKFSSICMQDAATSSNCPGNAPASNKGTLKKGAWEPKACPVHHSSSIKGQITTAQYARFNHLTKPLQIPLTWAEDMSELS